MEVETLILKRSSETELDNKELSSIYSLFQIFNFNLSETRASRGRLEDLNSIPGVLPVVDEFSPAIAACASCIPLCTNDTKADGTGCWICIPGRLVG